jgi:membrane protein required for colicin V production
MQAYDVFMLTVVGAAIAWGAWKGLAWQVASIASIGLSYFVAVNFRGPVSQFFHYDPPEWNNLLAMLVLYIGTSVVIWVAFNLIRDFLEKVQLKEFDRQVGGLVGGVKGVLICTVITMFTVGLGTETQRQAVVTSRSGYYIARLLEKVEPLLPAEYQQQLAQTIDQLEQRHGVAQGVYQQGLQLPFSWRPSQDTGWTTSQTDNGQNNGFGSGWGQDSNGASGQGSGWLTSQAEQQFRDQVLPRISEEEARVQREIDRFIPPRTGR